MVKSILLSKTFWVNALTFAVKAIDYLSGTNLIPSDMLALALAVVNIGLRIITKDPVGVP